VVTIFLTSQEHDGAAKKGRGIVEESPQERHRRRDEQIASDALALALKGLKPHPYLMPVFALAICAIYARTMPFHLLALWFGTFVLSLVPLALVLNRFFAREQETADTGRWITLATASYALTTLAWSTQSVLLWAPGDDFNHLLMVLFLAGYLSGQCPFTAPSKALTAALFAIDGTAFVLVPLRAGTFIYGAISFIAFFYTLYTLYLARQMHASANNALGLKFDRSELIVALSTAKQESDRARYSAESANRTKSQFLARMSHELRTPLNAILGFSEIVATAPAAREPKKNGEYAELVHKAGQHLLALINDILDLAKIEAGALQLREREIDIGRLIEEEFALMRPRADAAGIALRTEINEAAPLVLADERGIRQVVLNLASNALKFTPSGGTVTAFVDLSAGAALCFGVKDTGCGIAAEDQARVFDNFSQGAHDIAVPEKGTGLGLPIVKGLAEAHGGRVVLESEPGKGTCVTVYLPHERARPRTTARAA